VKDSRETIRGGEHVVIRPARAEDAGLYLDFLRDVAAEDLRMRFFGRVEELSAEELEKIAHPDYEHELVLVALEEGSARLLGIARLRTDLDEENAEYAILVRSRLKGHGLGWLLMQRVIAYAKERNLRRVYGDVLAANAGMLQMSAELGFRALDWGPDFKRVVLDLGAPR
jgi:acetyltransferase